jgi:thiamine transport system ATP-binding protein
MTSMPDGIVLRNVALQLGTADFRFDCTIPRGAITAIAGPSGAGKSTLLNLIAGFEQPVSGHILMEGRDYTVAHPAERPLSLVFQDHNLFAHLDIFTNVGLGVDPALRLTREQRARVQDALSRVGLAGFDKRMPGSLSGGEKQRAAFARALVRQKPILLLDEPFASLDPDLRNQMSDLLLELHRETRNTVVMVTHHRGDIRSIADHVLLVERGRIAADAPADDFLARLA